MFFDVNHFLTKMFVLSNIEQETNNRQSHLAMICVNVKACFCHQQA